MPKPTPSLLPSLALHLPTTAPTAHSPSPTPTTSPPSYPPHPSQWGRSRCLSLHLHPSFIRLPRPPVSHRHRHFPPSHPIPDQRIAGGHWLPAILRSCCRSPLLARYLRTCVRAGAPHRNHDPSQPSPRLRRRPPQRTKNLPSVSNDSPLPL